MFVIELLENSAYIPNSSANFVCSLYRVKINFSNYLYTHTHTDHCRISTIQSPLVHEGLDYKLQFYFSLIPDLFFSDYQTHSLSHTYIHKLSINFDLFLICL